MLSHSNMVPKPLKLMAPEQKRALLAQLLKQRPSNGPKFHKLSFAQQRLWFLDRLHDGDRNHLVYQALHLRGPLDVRTLEQSLRRIVARHDSLRTIFVANSGRPMQLVVPKVKLDFSIVDISGLPQDRQAERRQAEPLQQVARRIVARSLARCFRLDRGPLLRICLQRLAPQHHLLLIEMHHIIADAWSMAVLLRELHSLYLAKSQGRPAPLMTLPAQYTQFARWQHKRLNGPRLEQQLTYWRKQLADAPPVLDLPLDRPRPAVQSHRGGLLVKHLPQQLYDGLVRLSRCCRTTPFVLVLTAFQILLARLTGQHDLLVGVPFTNRDRTDFEPLIGCFINTLVLRRQLPPNVSYLDLLAGSRETVLDAFSHPDVPFDRLVQELKPERDVSYHPFCQVDFQLQTDMLPALELPGLEVTPEIVDSGMTAFDLVVQLEAPACGVMRSSVQYSTALFDRTTIQRWMDQYFRLLETVAQTPDVDWRQLPLLEPAQLHQLLVEWSTVADPAPRQNTPRVQLQPTTLLHHAFEGWVRERPDAIAVTAGQRQLSYRQLDVRAELLARRLLRLGVGPQVLVGLCVERHAELPVAILGILKTGGAYLPLDPVNPPQRLAQMLEDAGAPVLIAQRSTLDLWLDTELDTFGVQVLWLDEPEMNPDEYLASEATLLIDEIAPPAQQPDPDNLAYVIYTSGSTGQPKGMQITHRNVARLFTATRCWFDIRESDVWTLFHSYAFDFSVWEIWGAFLFGGRLVVVPRDTARSAPRFLELLEQEAVTSLSQTPSAFQELLAAQAQRGADHLDSSLRWVVFGGEALELHSLSPWYERYGEEAPKLINMYGITETTVHVTCRPLTRRDTQEASASVVGQPIPDLGVIVADTNLQATPVGIAGEMLIAGEGLGAGYLHRPSLTATRFIPSPYPRPEAGTAAGARGGRLYRSGDLGRYLPSGELEYLGRIDRQVKIRGFRIELAEIEAVLNQRSDIERALVSTRESTSGSQLIAYVIPAEGISLEVGAIKVDLRHHLPEYMVPAAFISVPSIPLTTNGKADLRALQSLATLSEEQRCGSGYLAPQSQLQQHLADIWQRLLEIEQVGIHDDFFDLGGHSLLASRIQAAVRDEMEIEIPLAVLFERTTVAQLAEYIEDLKAGEARKILEALLDDIEHMSDAEVDQLL